MCNNVVHHSDIDDIYMLFIISGDGSVGRRTESTELQLYADVRHIKSSRDNLINTISVCDSVRVYVVVRETAGSDGGLAFGTINL
jgi:hypothetical protein